MSTFGLWNITPNFYNAVPRSVRVDIDIRDSDKERRDSIITQTLEGAEKIAKQRKCGYTGGVQWQYPIATSDKKVHFFAIATSTAALPLSCSLMPSDSTQA